MQHLEKVHCDSDGDTEPRCCELTSSLMAVVMSFLTANALGLVTVGQPHAKVGALLRMMPRG